MGGENRHEGVRMIIKFNKFERVAGLFVAAAVVGSVLAAVAVAVKKGWFSSKIPYETVMTSADGIHSGTLVQIAGLRAGSVDDVELLSADKVRVRFAVMEKFRKQIRTDSKIQILRPFIIGEKVLEVSVGSENENLMPPGDVIPVHSSFDIMDLVSGKKLGPFLGTLDKLSDNLRVLGEAFSDSKRTESLVKMFDRVGPLLVNMNKMAISVNRVTDGLNNHKRLEILVGNLTTLTSQVNHVVAGIQAESPNAGRDLGLLIRNLGNLVGEMEKLTPAITAIAPELPRTTLKAVEALNEAVVLLKAFQKSFLLRGSVKEVKEEEARKPASDSSGK
jgi:phospholipid/cholesterol/gamma-HCH transport system substrate-binding protein